MIERKHERLYSISINYKYYLIVLLFTLIPRLIVMMGVKPLRTVTDELITIAGGAYFSGLDWSNILSYSGRYYGSGFTMLLGWIFKLTDDPIIIYRVYLLGCIFLQVGIGIICFHMMDRCFGIANKMYSTLASITCSYLVVTRATIVYNEHMLIFLSWCIALILVKLVINRCNKKRHLYTAILCLILCYSLTIHTRAYTFWISLIIVTILYYWTYRKWILSIPVMVGGAVGGFCVNILVELLRTGMYSAVSGEELYNASISLSGVKYLTSIDSWQMWLSIVLGQINTISIFTGGIMILCIVFCTHHIFASIFKRKVYVANIIKETEIGMAQYFLPVIIFFCASIAMTIFAQSVSWLGGATREFMGIGDGTGYSYKAFTYVRYFGPYCGPILLVLFSYIYRFKASILKYFKSSVWLFSVLQVYWVFNILPIIKNNSYVTEVFLPLAHWDYVKPRLRTFAIATIVMVIIFGITWLCYYKRKFIIPVVLLCFLLIYEYEYNAIVFDKAYQDNINYSDAEESYIFIKWLSSQIEIPDKIYVYDGREIENQQSFYEYQFLLNRYSIIPGVPDRQSSDAIILSNMVLDYEVLSDISTYVYCRLSNEQLIYIKGERLIDQLEKSDIELYHID